MVTFHKVEQAQQLLERYRKDLHALPGVVGTGIGLRSVDANTNEVVVQVFVRSAALAEEVQKKASVLLGTSQIEVIISGDMITLES